MKIYYRLSFIIGIMMLTAVWTGAQEEDADYYIRQNDKLKTLEEFKDSEDMIRAKLKHLDLINEFRAGINRKLLKLDILACRVANMQSYNAAVNNYMGHWDLNGYKPYIRYSLAGGRDHVTENASAEWGSGAEIAGMSDVNEARKYMKRGLDGFLAEGPGGGHYDNIADLYHNYVGLGYFGTNLTDRYQVRYYEEYIDRYIEWDDFPLKTAENSDLTISGTVIPKDAGVYAVTVYYEDFPSKMTPSRINGMGSYPDFTSTVYKQLWPWNLSFNKDTREFRIKMKFGKKGFYYVQVFLKKGIEKIPYKKQASVTTAGLANASGVVIKVE